ncbi:CZB domain-containing protein [Pontibacter roseus]|uniref:CZB domain-containing protein n=1 Tax=Pontibacter roseus TaxID=336989 RepID=UPI000370C53E|nr:CZB domain-containing protein [Pontibacter roseus]
MDIAQIDFQQLRIKHILYKSKVRSFLYGGTFDAAFFSSAGPIDVWFTTVGRVRYASEPAISSLARLHREMNSLALELYTLYSNGNIDQAHEGLKSVEMKSDQFIELLSNLDKKLQQK